MAEETLISWADHTFNGFIGCTRVSPACDGCYAAHLMETRMGRVQWGGPGVGAGTRERTSVANWRKPVTWNKKAAAEGKRPFVFCSSLADVFDNEVPTEWRRDLFDLIRATPNLVWLLLTKRPQNIVKLFRQAFDIDGGAEYTAQLWPLNAAIGTTVEDQERADRNVFHLVRAKHALKPAFAFLSCEPLLGPIAIEDITEIDWVITGGETDQGAHKARPTHPDWFRSLRDECASHGISFHHKQNGEWLDERMLDREPVSASNPVHCLPHTFPDGTTVRKVGKKHTGRMLDGVTHDDFPEIRV
ncbi:protein gp37 [Rhizobium azibense]|uniref:Protein gp37 n=2 Tax=Rhizobium azibense TaxID=1136135 RepID=A0A4V6P1B4_9HYPH|nr:phage Gp37/Gp68 family protein [Rhizobium azibense]TCU34035.1 protein gp37 [Rhizobium azibense]